MTARERAAAALDSTWACAEADPYTIKARATLAAYLDDALPMAADLVRAYCGYLEHVAAMANRADER